MGRHRTIHPAVLAALLVLLPGCSSTAERSADPADPGTPSSAASERAGATDGPDQPVEPDPLVGTPVDGVPGGIDDLLRADDGSTMVVLANQGRDVTHYRIYDGRWRPMTPPLQVEATLTMERGLRHGFVGRAARSLRSGRYEFNRWVTIDVRGRIHPLTRRDGGTLQQGDRLLPSYINGRFAHRAVADAVVTVARPRWQTAAPSTQWHAQRSGTACAQALKARVGDIVHSSIDDGRTWVSTETSGLPAGTGPRLQSCLAARNRVVVMTGGEYPRWLHTFERSTGLLLSSLAIGDGTPVDGYDWGLLPDGTVFAGTSRPGMVVGTDSTNAAVVFRGGPVRGGSWSTVLGSQLVQVRDDRVLAVSDDRGVTWGQVDLELPR